MLQKLHGPSHDICRIDDDDDDDDDDRLMHGVYLLPRYARDAQVLPN
jgi:hypothetical protein